MSVKIAVVGTGNVARNSYLQFLSEQEDVALTYLSRTRSKAEACAEDFGGCVVDSAEELLAGAPDAILVLTRETQRYEAASSLLEGKPRRLFFEKPLVAQQGQANVCEDDFHKAADLLERSRASGTETAMVFNYRFFDQTVRMEEIIAERGFGKLIQASMFVNYACWSHCIDLLHLFGGRASQVTALAGCTQYGDAVDVSGSFRLANGATGTILGTNGFKFDFPLYQILLSFEQGTIRFGDLDGPMEVYDTSTRYRETHDLIGHHSRWDQYRSSFEKSLAAYLDSVRQGGPPPVPGIAGLEELQFEVALRRSIEQNRPVDVQDEFPIDA
ncbi:MAG: Gfo/Idh/MocA family oxidoreductase [Candidatus Latescibacteria bacterium]|jgi:predicted dehydrogenase|nr:Gfo/Idh/MocA family oxidoreductase [Candidatus Latescibacterota bacterium]